MSEEMLKAMPPGMVPGRHRLFCNFSHANYQSTGLTTMNHSMARRRMR
jgi:hypothetical protein